MTPPPPPSFSVAERFTLEFGSVVTTFVQLYGLTREHDVVELKESGPDGRLVVRKLPGEWQAGKVVLTRALTADRSFDNILTAAHASTSDIRSDARILAHDATGSPVATYRLVNAWPRKVEIVTFELADEATVAERLTLVYEQVERT